ncbi:MAG: ABC transporter permease [Mesorhizobium sp.]|nr:MAG: ABC transporter permease [Mesorhizobium sp.]
MSETSQSLVSAPVSPGRAKFLRFLVRDAGVLLALVLITLFFSVSAPYFATPGNALKIFVQIAINTVLAAGMTFVILTGVSDNSTITGLPQSFVDFGNLIIGGFLPSIFLVAVLVIAAGWFVLRFTVFGRMIFAVGTNDEAVRLSGHNPDFYKVAAFTISGLTAGIAAMVYLLRLNIGSPIAGVGYELNAIAAVIIGGTSLSGGKGSIVGTLVGACILQVLSTGLQLLGVGDNFKPIVIGLVIVLAVILDAYRERLLRRIR